MGRIALLLLAAGCQFHTNGQSAGDGGGDGPISTGGDAGADASSDAAMPAPFMLTGLRWLMPCTDMLTNQNCHCAAPATVNIAVPGTGRWLVTARIRGAMEGLVYGNGTAPASGTGWYIGGDTNGDNGDNEYELTISSPVQHFFLNYGPTGHNYSMKLDYMATFVVDGGATVSFFSSGQDTLQWANYDSQGQPITFAGVTTTPDPYDGQFGQLDVISAVLQ